MSHQRRAVFLDRDGTLIVEPNGVAPRSVDGVVLAQGVPEAVKLLKDMGFLLVVTTNQSAVGRGEVGPREVREINERIDDLLILSGAPTIDAYYICPHTGLDGCFCRKPRPGLLTMAAEDLGISLHYSYLIGNSLKDLQAGDSAGLMRSYLVGANAAKETKTMVPCTVLDAAKVISIREACNK